MRIPSGDWRTYIQNNDTKPNEEEKWNERSFLNVLLQ